MSAIFVILFIAAVVGIFKPYIKGAKRWHFAVAAVVCFIAVGVTAPERLGPNPAAGVDDATMLADATGEVTETPEAESAPTSKWRYQESSDEMRGTTTRFASLESENTVDLEFPYGTVSGIITIRQRPEDGLNVMFSVDSGQILCRSFGESHISAKFDSGPVRNYDCTDAADGTNDTAFITSESAFLGNLKKADKVIIEAEFYRQGRQQFTFETAGLKWEN